MNQDNETALPDAKKNPVWWSGIAVSILLGWLIAWLGSFESQQFVGYPVFTFVIAWAYLVNWLVFVPSFVGHSEKYFDLTGALTYISAVLISVCMSNDLDLRGWLAAILVIIWAGRLGSFLFKRIQRDGHDVRFDQMKYDFWQFLMTWTIQALWVSLTASAAFVIITSVQRESFGWFGVLGLVIWVLGFSIEVIADLQKSKFKMDEANKERFINTGLWALSRHPNYFGEIVLWTGMLVMSLPLLSGTRWFVVISPVFVYLLLTRVSGIPMLQKRAQSRWGADPEFQAYLQNTRLLVPLPKTFRE
ncbi:MAG: DUF1295 domain-containing protein [Planctomycetota bacterium]